MERNSTYGQDLLFLFHLPASSAGASLLERSYPALGREPSPFRPWYPGCRLLWTLPTAPPLPRSPVLCYWLRAGIRVISLRIHDLWLCLCGCGYMVTFTSISFRRRMPSFKIICCALPSRSWQLPHSGQVHSRTVRFLTSIFL